MCTRLDNAEREELEEERTIWTRPSGTPQHSQHSGRLTGRLQVWVHPRQLGELARSCFKLKTKKELWMWLTSSSFFFFKNVLSLSADFCVRIKLVFHFLLFLPICLRARGTMPEVRMSRSARAQRWAAHILGVSKGLSDLTEITWVFCPAFSSVK